MTYHTVRFNLIRKSTFRVSLRLMLLRGVRKIDLPCEADIDWARRWTMIVEPEAEFAPLLGTTQLDVLGLLLSIEPHLILLCWEVVSWDGRDTIYLLDHAFLEGGLIRKDCALRIWAVDEFDHLLHTPIQAFCNNCDWESSFNVQSQQGSQSGEIDTFN